MLALRALLTHLVDYAGLFPPAARAMGPAVRQYAAYRASDAAWMLGRFVVPVARLEEFEAAAGALLPANAEPPDAPDPWRLSALVGGDAAADLRAARSFNARHAGGAEAGRAVIDALEAKAGAPDDVARLADAVRRAGLDDAALYVELPPGADAAAYARAATAAGARLKLRTGGVTADAFPPRDAVLAFLAACAAHDVAAKCTAGLHHPLRGEHALTYESGCARGTMYGFVGVFLAAALLHAGHAPADVAPLLEERDPGAFAFGADDALAWRGTRVDSGTVADARVRRLVAFGSCSFEEPLRDLQALGWWPGPTPP